MMVCQSAPPASAPLPRLTARSMLSFGTEVFLAFWTASNRVGLPARSPPPVRAATSMFLMSLANSLPRLASIAAFLCLVVAHLEWPDIVLLLVRRPRAPCRRTARAPGGPRSAQDGTRLPAATRSGRRRSYPPPARRPAALGSQGGPDDAARSAPAAAPWP